MWTNCVNLTIFDGYMSYFDQTDTCMFTCIYGYPNHKNTHLTYSIIKDLHKINNIDECILFDDFNKQGGDPIDMNIINMFNDTINYCNLNDIGFIGNIFTWTNNQLDKSHPKSKPKKKD